MNAKCAKPVLRGVFASAALCLALSPTEARAVTRIDGYVHAIVRGQYLVATNARVEIWRDGQLISVRTTNARGLYETGPLTPGQYQIRAYWSYRGVNVNGRGNDIIIDRRVGTGHSSVLATQGGYR